MFGHNKESLHQKIHSECQIQVNWQPFDMPGNNQRPEGLLPVHILISSYADCVLVLGVTKHQGDLFVFGQLFVLLLQIFDVPDEFISFPSLQATYIFVRLLFVLLTALIVLLFRVRSEFVFIQSFNILLFWICDRILIVIHYERLLFWFETHFYIL